MAPPATEGRPEADLALRVTLPEHFAEVAGAVLMDRLGPFEQAPAGPGTVTLVFYPPAERSPTDDEIMAVLPPGARGPGRVQLERAPVSRDWVDGWKQHFRPIVVGEVRVRPPWEPSVPTEMVPTSPEEPAPVDVVINPGLGFGTGLHPTTRGTLQLLQYEAPEMERRARLRGPLVDAGTGSGILAIAAAKLGWGPVFAFDNDAEALTSAQDNIEANEVESVVELHRAEVSEASPFWFAGATVLANMTLEPVVALVRKIAHDVPTLEGMVTDEWPERLVVSGILAGGQEQQLLEVAASKDFLPGQRLHEAEWVSLELFPARTGSPPDAGMPHRGR